jgi:hypothetical protein
LGTVARKRGGKAGEVRRVRRWRRASGWEVEEVDGGVVEDRVEGESEGGVRGEAGEEGDASFWRGLLGRRKDRERVLRGMALLVMDCW